MRLVLFGDQHFGRSASFEGKLRKLSHQAGPLTERLVRACNEELTPDLVINLGDVIEDASAAEDAANYRTFLDLLGPLRAPTLHVAGNHDTLRLSEAQVAELWGRPGQPLYYAEQLGELELLVLHTQEQRDVGVRLPEEQLQWLGARLEAGVGPALVLMHHPASDCDLRGNRWFQRAPHLCRVANRGALRRVLERSGRVLAVFNGHAHWNHLQVCQGIPYITLQSLTENLDDDAPGRAAAAFAVCELERGRLSVSVRGEQPARYEFELRASPASRGAHARISSPR